MRGVRQGYVLLPIYRDGIFANALMNIGVGFRINEEYSNNLRYADYTVLLTTKLGDL